MENKQGPNPLAQLTFRVLAMRDVVVRLLAYEAQRWENPDDLFRDFAENIEGRITRVSTRAQKPSIQSEEGIRKEIDWILAAARKSLPADKES